MALFNSQFGLPPSHITTVLVNGTNPGISSDETESLLDLEWSHVVAPGALDRFYLGDSRAHTPNGPIVDAIQRAVNDNECGTISVSFGLCGAPPSFYTGTVSPIYAQAAAQGQSIFIASGDYGAAGVVASFSQCVPGTSRHINELAGDPNVTEVGGTSFGPPYYFGSGSGPDAAWNTVYQNPPNPPQQLATGGGASAIYSKPTYQKGRGVPGDGARDVPDVAMVAALDDPYAPGVFFAADNAYGTPTIQCCLVGTSLSAQLWAGISKLIAQAVGRQGPLNPQIYAMAAAELSGSGLYDIVNGNNNYGSVIGFNAKPGYDQTTGWGDVSDINTFIDSLVPAPTIISVTSPILVGYSFTITGTSFSRSPKVSFWVSSPTAEGIYALLTPSSVSSTKLIVPVPASVPLGEGFAGVQVVEPNLSFKVSNVAGALLQGSAAAGIPTILRLNGVPLAPSSSKRGINNVETVIVQGTSVTMGGTGFDAAHGVAVNIFCACPGGRVSPVFVNPGSGGLTSDSFSFSLPVDVPTGSASLVVINKGVDGSYSKSSNAVSVPVGARISVTSVTQSGSTITVNGTGFSTATVINFFNLQGGVVVNLEYGPYPPINLIDSTQFTFTKPAGSVAGPAYVQALNPPFLPYDSSGNDPGGAFTLQ